MNSLKVAAATFGSFALLLVAGCDSQECCDDGDVDNTDFVASETFSYDIPLAQKTRMRLSGINGNVRIEAEDGRSSVLIAGERRVGSSSRQDAEDHLDLLEVIVTETGSEVQVRTEQPDESRGRNYVVEYEIFLPRALEARVANINGNLTVVDVGGGTRVETVNGNVSVDLGTVSEGDIDLATVNGNIGLGIPSSTSANLSASVVNGNINISGLALSNLVTTPTSTTGVIGSGDISIELGTVNGNITVTGHD
jgi:hypothetical protein